MICKQLKCYANCNKKKVGCIIKPMEGEWLVKMWPVMLMYKLDGGIKFRVGNSTYTAFCGGLMKMH